MPEPVALGIKVPDSMATLGSVMNTANAMQQYKLGNVELQKQQIMLGERKGIQDLFRNPQQFNDADGNPDYNRLINEGMKVAPTTFPTMVPQIIAAHQSSIAAKAAMNSLDKERRAAVGEYTMTLADDTPKVARQKLDALLVENPQLKPYVDHAWKYSLEPKANDPAGWRDAALKLGKTAMSAPQQAGAVTPSGPIVSTTDAQGRPATGMLNVNPLAGPTGMVQGATAPQAVSPSGLETIETDAAGNKHIVSRSPQGAILSTRPVPGSVDASGNPIKSGFATLRPGQGADIAAAQDETHRVRLAADQAPQQTNINSTILRLSKGTDTGPGTERWQNTLGAVAALWGGNASSYQELGKYLEKNAISNMTAMGGPPSDARLSAAAAANGSTSFNPTALQDVTKFNDATNSALIKYRQGVDSAVGLRNSDYTALPTFKSAWAKNLDVNIFRVENAVRDNDIAELAKIKLELGADGLKKLATKRKNLEALSSTGRLP